MDVENIVYRFLNDRVDKMVTVEILGNKSYAGLLQDFSMSALLLKTVNSPSEYILLPVDTILSITYMEDL